MGARQLRDERTPGVQADQVGQSQFPIPGSSGSSVGAADEVEGIGGDTDSLWLSAADGAAETGRLVGECETNLSVVSGGRIKYEAKASQAAQGMFKTEASAFGL